MLRTYYALKRSSSTSAAVYSGKQKKQMLCGCYAFRSAVFGGTKTTAPEYGNNQNRTPPSPLLHLLPGSGRLVAPRELWNPPFADGKHTKGNSRAGGREQAYLSCPGERPRDGGARQQAADLHQGAIYFRAAKVHGRVL